MFHLDHLFTEPCYVFFYVSVFVKYVLDACFKLIHVQTMSPLIKAELY